MGKRLTAPAVVLLLALAVLMGGCTSGGQVNTTAQGGDCDPGATTITLGSQLDGRLSLGKGYDVYCLYVPSGSSELRVTLHDMQADFDLYRERMLAELAPASPMESMLAERIITLSWRLKRTGRIQNQAIDALNADNTSSPLAKLAKSISFKLLDTPQCPASNSNAHLTLGRIAIKDFSNARVLDRLLMYERRIEHSLYRTILELQRLNLIRKLDPGCEMPFNQLTS